MESNTGKYMSIAQMRAAHPDEWVLLTGLRHGKYHRLLGGVVRFHHQDREKVIKQMGLLQGKANRMVFYTGQLVPDDFLNAFFE